MEAPRDQRRRLILGSLAWAMFSLGVIAWVTPKSAWNTDRWRREELAERFPAGEVSQPLLLANSASVAAFAEIRCAAWTEPRPELLLPGETQLVELPLSAGQKAEVRYRALDIQRQDVVHVVALPADWALTSVDVDEDGEVTSWSKRGGDSSPRRGLVGVDSEYSLPVRVDLPFEPHWRLSGDAAERRAWIGPGTRDDSDQCAYVIGPPVSVTLRVPRRTDLERVIEIGGDDGATRLTMKPDGTVDRDAIPVWRRISQVAGF